MRHMHGHNRYNKTGRSQLSRHNRHRKPKQERKEEKPIGNSAKEYDPESWRGKLPMFPGTGILLFIL